MFRRSQILQRGKISHRQCIRTIWTRYAEVPGKPRDRGPARFLRSSDGMSPRRVVIPDVTLHARHRANDHLDVFIDDEDRSQYLELLRNACREHAIDVHNYTLMRTHSHVLLTPRTAEGLPQAMHDVGQAYSRYFNRKHERGGTLWHGPYDAKEVPDEEYALICMRYIEQNSVRANIVARPEEYEWSSYAIHACGKPSDWIVSHAVYNALGKTPEERQAAFRAICGEPLPQTQIRGLREPLCRRRRSNPPRRPDLAMMLD